MARTTDLHDIRPRERSHPAPGSIEQLVEAAVTRAVTDLLEPYLVRITEPVPLVYTVAQAAAVLQVSPDTVSRLIRRGVLDRVPHIDGKQLIPRASLENLVAGSSTTGAADSRSRTQLAAGSAASSNIRSMSSAASRSEPGMK